MAELAGVEADVLVVGGGILGVCTAHALARRGVRVALCERGKIASGCSYGNAGWISPSRRPLPMPGVIAHALEWLFDPESPFYIRPRADPALWRWLWRFQRACHPAPARETFRLSYELTRASALRFAELAKDLSFDHAERGLLVACQSAEALERLESERQMFAELGGDSEGLDAGALAARVPELSRNLAGGVFFPGDAHISPAAFVRALAEVAAREGATIHEGCELLALETDGPRIVRAITTHGAFAFEQIVVAAGAHTPSLVAPLGVRVPIQGAKGYSLTGRSNTALEVPILLYEAKVAVTPLGRHVRIAGTLELAGLDTSINLRRVSALRRAVERYLPGLEMPARVETWRGLRPLTPDDRPILGRTRRFSNLVLATGHGMSGISQGPASGELIAQILTGESPFMDPAPFDPRRFD